MTGTVAETAIFEGSAGEGPAAYRWLHFPHAPATRAALSEECGLPEFVVNALLEEDTMPRASETEAYSLVFLRGLTEAPGGGKGELVSLRLAITAGQIVSVEMRRLPQVDEMIAAFRDGAPPPAISLFLLALVRGLRARIETALDTLEERVASLEEAVLSTRTRHLELANRARLNLARLRVVQLHRHMLPQAHALTALTGSGAAWQTNKRRLREEAAAFTRIATDLDALRLRAQLVAEEDIRAVTDRTNRILLLLSVVSVVFLPLTFLTGLLGSNLAGIPYAEAPWAFGAFVIFLTAVAAIAGILALRLLR